MVFGHSTIATSARLIAQTLADYGCDSEALFKQAGLDKSRLKDPVARFPAPEMQNLWRLSVESTGDDCFGISVAEHMQPGAMHGLGFAWLSSENLHDALKRLIRYQRTLTTVARLKLQETDEKVCLVVNAISPTPGVSIVNATMDMAMAVMARMCQLSYGPGFDLAGVTMCRPRPGCDRRMEKFFGREIVFDAEFNLLCLSREIVSAPLPHANSELARANDRVVAEYLERFDRSQISLRARAWIIDKLPSGQPTQANLANDFHMSVRKLQRKLKDEGTTFKELLDDTRCELAKQFIREEHRSIGEIAFLLGFSEVSNFTRAFRRWTGKSPKEFRHSP